MPRHKEPFDMQRRNQNISWRDHCFRALKNTYLTEAAKVKHFI
jgi:hypothetical protein